MNVLFIASVLLAVVSCAHSACKSSPPTLPPGGKWVPNEGCTSGKVYFTAGANRQKCHCWGHCGYVCEPSKGGGNGGGNNGGGGGGSGGSPCPFGGVYFNGKGQRCHCQSFNKKPYYVCESTTTTASSGSNSTASTAPSSTTAASGASSTTASAGASASTTAGSTTAGAQTTTAAGSTTGGAETTTAAGSTGAESTTGAAESTT